MGAGHAGRVVQRWFSGVPEGLGYLASNEQGLRGRACTGSTAKVQGATSTKAP